METLNHKKVVFLQGENNFTVRELLDYVYNVQQSFTNEVFPSIERVVFNMLKNEYQFRRFAKMFADNYVAFLQDFRYQTQRDTQTVLIQLERMIYEEKISSNYAISLDRLETKTDRVNNLNFFSKFELWNKAYYGDNKSDWDKLEQILSKFKKELSLLLWVKKVALTPLVCKVPVSKKFKKDDLKFRNAVYEYMKS